MRLKLLFIPLLLTLTACGQTVEKQNQKSEKKRVIGTRIYINQPENFKTSKDFVGFESGQSLIQFIDLFGGNYNSNARNFTKKNLELKGIQVIDFEELQIDNYPAKMALIQGNEYQKSLQLIFGDNDFSVFAMAFIPNYEKNKIEEIKKSFLTIEYEKDRVLDPFENAFFELDDSKSIYKYARATSNFFFYSLNGVQKDDYKEESFYMISQIPTESMNENPKSLFEDNLNSLKKNGLVVSKRSVTDRKELNGFEFYEELVIGKLNNQESQIKITSVVKGSRAVLINALAKDNYELTLQEFDKLTNELKMK